MSHTASLMGSPVVIGDCELWLGDNVEVLPRIGHVDAVLTDPPYGIGEHGGRKRYGPASKARGFSGWSDYEKKDWDSAPPDKETLALLAGWPAIIWGANHYASRLPADSPCWLVWHKKGSDRSSFADCELAWTNLPGAVRYFRHDWVGFGAINSGVKREHPTQKPLPLMEWCLEFLGDAETILDPYMGSGTTGIACIKAGRRFVGIERDPDYFEIAVRRIRAAHSADDTPLFAGAAE